MNTPDPHAGLPARLGSSLSFILAGLTALTFGVAVFTPPLSGPFCTAGCFVYPFPEAVTRFPRDYYWMVPAILMTMAYLAWAVCIHRFASEERKVFSLAGLAFALLAAGILIVNYYLQLNVVQPALLNGETDGIALLSQFNPHGVFIALEELGYLLMSVSFILTALVFTGANTLERVIRTVFTAGFGLALGSFLAVLVQHGLRREYYFEVYVISINYLVLIVNAILVGIYFRRNIRA